MKPGKIYDFDIRKTSRTLVQSFRRKQEATVADLIADTGLPKHQVEESIKAVTHEYGGRMQVTGSGEILYSFPRGMKSRYDGFGPRLRRILGRLGSWTATAASLLFKLWIMIMLVGYFALFVAILVLAIIASVAKETAENRGGRRSRGMSFGSFYLVTRLIDLFIHIWLYGSLTRSFDGRGPGYRRTVARRSGGRPLHKAVFAFVFGDGDPNADWAPLERTGTIRFIQSRKGVVTVEELMALTGRDYDAAQQLVSALLLEYEGEPAVSEQGTLYFQFPELMRTRDLPSESTGSGIRKQLVPFNGNEAKMNRWIAGLNSVNIFFGGFFLYSAALASPQSLTGFPATIYTIARSMFSGTGNPDFSVAIALGVVPFLFSLLFYLIPFVRNLRRERENAKVRETNFRMKVYRNVLEHPEEIIPASVRTSGADESVSDPEAECERVLSDLGARKGVEIEERPDGRRSYRFPDIGRERNDMRDLRAGIDPSKYAPGDTVFDTGS